MKMGGLRAAHLRFSGISRMHLLHRSTLRRTALAAALGTTLVLCGGAAAQAATAPPIVVALKQASSSSASFFEVAGRRGHTVTAGKLVISNRSGRAVRVLVDRVDALTATTLGSAYKVRGLAIHGPTRWTRLSRKRVTIGPHGRATIRVRVRVPRRARAGDYLSGIGVQTQGKRKVTKLGSNVSVSSVQRYAIGLQVKLPGARRPQVVLTKAGVKRQPSGVVFTVHARNSGNVILKNVTGTIRVSRGSRTVARVPVGPGSFITGTAIDYPAAARSEQPSASTEYRVRATLRYAGGTAHLDRKLLFGKREARAQQDFGGPRVGSGSSTWWRWLVIAAGALAGLAGAYRLGTRRTS
jgi:hypothetical protein